MSRIRRAVELASRGRVVRRSLPRDLGRGKLYVTPESALRYWGRNLGDVDPGLLDSARVLVRPGASVWDVGANCGLFTFAAAHLAGPDGYVLAVEPDTFLASLLNRSSAAATPDTADTDVLVCAASDTVGVADLGIAARGRSANAIGAGRSQTGGFRGTQSTVTVTLDWLAKRFRRPDIIKIDVEGHELRVLEGGSEVLTRDRPVLHIEIAGPDESETAGLLASHGYELYDASQPGEPIEHGAFNTIARPVEKGDSRANG